MKRKIKETEKTPMIVWKQTVETMLCGQLLEEMYSLFSFERQNSDDEIFTIWNGWALN